MKFAETMDKATATAVTALVEGIDTELGKFMATVAGVDVLDADATRFLAGITAAGAHYRLLQGITEHEKAEHTDLSVCPSRNLAVANYVADQLFVLSLYPLDEYKSNYSHLCAKQYAPNLSPESVALYAASARVLEWMTEGYALIDEVGRTHAAAEVEAESAMERRQSQAALAEFMLEIFPESGFSIAGGAE